MLALAFAASSGSVGRKALPTAYSPCRGRSKSTSLRKKPSGNLQQHAGAVTGLGVSTNSAAMVQVAQRLEPLVDDVAAGDPSQGRDKGDARGIMFEGRIVKARALRTLQRALAVVISKLPSLKPGAESVSSVTGYG